MIKSVEWTNRATRDLRNIAEFYKKLYGKEKARKIVTSIRKSTEALEKKGVSFSEIGSIDDAFIHLKHTYRKLIEQHCKIIPN